MFGKVIFLDTNKLNDYMVSATGKIVTKVNSMQITSDKDIGLDTSIISAGIKGTKTYEASILSSSLHEIEKFENAILNRDDFFNFQTRVDIDLETIPRGSIIKFDGYIYVPTEFDFTHLIGQFKSMISEDITSDMEKSESAAFNKFFEIHNPKIPITSEITDYLLCSLIEAEHLKINYPELEEYETTEITILARVIASSFVPKIKPLFDPLKDFLSMSRAVRREIASNRPDGMKSIYCDSDYKKIEIIAIYQ